ncbi:MAG: chitin-binding domain-containing protein [Rhodobacter sp.]|nr:chitin-binding domain-containing protein [Rhodobacter sp.]
MKIKTALFAALLAAAPSLAFAMGCNWEHSTQEAMSCAEGTIWDAETETCVDIVTS